MCATEDASKVCMSHTQPTTCRTDPAHVIEGASVEKGRSHTTLAACVVATTVALAGAIAASLDILVGSSAGSLAAVDGVDVVAGDDILVMHQRTRSQNGVYTVTNTGGPSTPWSMERRSDLSSVAPTAGPGSIVPVTLGVVGSNTFWAIGGFRLASVGVAPITLSNTTVLETERVHNDSDAYGSAPRASTHTFSESAPLGNDNTNAEGSLEDTGSAASGAFVQRPLTRIENSDGTAVVLLDDGNVLFQQTGLYMVMGTFTFVGTRKKHSAAIVRLWNISNETVAACGIPSSGYNHHSNSGTEYKAYLQSAFAIGTPSTILQVQSSGSDLYEHTPHGMAQGLGDVERFGSITFVRLA